MNENAKRVILSRAAAALLAVSLVPPVSAAEIANALTPPAVVQEAEVQQTEQTLEPAAEEKELQQVQELRQEAAALAAEGDSTLAGLDHLRRGYDQLEQNLKNLGAGIKSVDIPAPFVYNT